jgi:hypothetical protein
MDRRTDGLLYLNDLDLSVPATLHHSGKSEHPSVLEAIRAWKQLSGEAKQLAWIEPERGPNLRGWEIDWIVQKRGGTE